MIPESQDYFSQDESQDNYLVLPSKTYKLDLVNGRIMGTIDGAQAVMQFIKKVLNTDKYAFEIYDWYYGNELIKLVGKPYDFIITEIPRIVEEALLVDDRIKEVNSFNFNQTSIDSLVCSFMVVTVYGSIKYEMEVNI